jgi:hypothetical protein
MCIYQKLIVIRYLLLVTEPPLPKPLSLFKNKDIVRLVLLNQPGVKMQV